MTDQKLIAAMRRMALKKEPLICQGCGYEHNCSLHGCAVLRAAADRLTELSIPPSNPPLTLEELWEMDWEPAWIDGERETEIGRSGWAIIWYSSVEKYVCIWWPGEDCADIPSLESYMDTWLAYRRKPEEVKT
ncbi:MAG: hypothetical protein HDT20_03940 [Oscillibacter sp.]|nr:hypothetical protein [Oscillibacter sp.]